MYLEHEHVFFSHGVSSAVRPTKILPQALRSFLSLLLDERLSCRVPGVVVQYRFAVARPPPLHL